MKYYLKIAGGMVFLIANYYGLKLSFMAMTYPSDLTFFAGVFGLALLLLTDALIVVRVLRKYLPTNQV